MEGRFEMRRSEGGGLDVVAKVDLGEEGLAASVGFPADVAVEGFEVEVVV